MSMAMNEGVKVHYKAVTSNVLTVVVLLVETSTAIEKTKGFLESYIYISKNLFTVTYISPVIPPFLGRRDVRGGGDGAGVLCPPRRTL